MGLTTKKEEQLRKMPHVETSISKSKDGRLIFHKTIITDIKPVAYYQAVFDRPIEHVDVVEEVIEEAVQ